MSGGSNPQYADIIRSESGQTVLARILVDSIQRFFPDGGLIAFSVGHKYKTSRPNDRGAALAGGGTEADNAEKVLEKAANMLSGVEAVPEERTIRVMQGDRLLFETEVDEDAVVVWSSGRLVVWSSEKTHRGLPLHVSWENLKNWPNMSLKADYAGRR